MFYFGKEVGGGGGRSSEVLKCSQILLAIYKAVELKVHWPFYKLFVTLVRNHLPWIFRPLYSRNVRWEGGGGGSVCGGSGAVGPVV